MDGAPGRDQPATDIYIRPAWRRDDAAIEADAIDFWTRLGILPQGVSPEQRAKELVVAAYRDGRLIAVTTAVLERIESLRGRFAVIRGAVDPDHRRTHVGIAIAIHARETLEAWAAAHPEEKIAGMAGVIENQDIAARLTEPYWPVTRLGLVGHMPDGRQIRVAWFREGRVDV